MRRLCGRYVIGLLLWAPSADITMQDVGVDEDVAEEGGDDIEDEHNGMSLSIFYVAKLTPLGNQGTIPIMAAGDDEEGDISEADE